MWLVKVLIGQNNDSDYLLFGKITKNAKTAGYEFSITQKAREKGISNNTSYVTAFMWVMKHLFQGIEPVNTEIWHAGKCGRCGRKLTVPQSIEIGLGPECATKGFE